MMRFIQPLALAMAVCAVPGAALALNLPSNALLTAEIDAPLTSIALPIGPYADQGIETLAVEGAVNHSAWRIRGAGAITTLQILAPLRDQLRADGFDVVFQVCVPVLRRL